MSALSSIGNHQNWNVAAELGFLLNMRLIIISAAYDLLPCKYYRIFVSHLDLNYVIVVGLNLQCIKRLPTKTAWTTTPD